MVVVADPFPLHPPRPIPVNFRAARFLNTTFDQTLRHSSRALVSHALTLATTRRRWDEHCQCRTMPDPWRVYLDAMSYGAHSLQFSYFHGHPNRILDFTSSLTAYHSSVSLLSGMLVALVEKFVATIT